MNSSNTYIATPLLEEVPDRLLEYYFNQHLAGMSIEQIRESLETQVAQPESIEYALISINNRFIKHKRKKRFKRDANLLGISGLSFITASVVLSTLSYFSVSDSYGFKLFYGLLLAGLICVSVSLWFKRIGVN